MKLIPINDMHLHEFWKLEVKKNSFADILVVAMKQGYKDVSCIYRSVLMPGSS